MRPRRLRLLLGAIALAAAPAVQAAEAPVFGPPQKAGASLKACPTPAMLSARSQKDTDEYWPVASPAWFQVLRRCASFENFSTRRSVPSVPLLHVAPGSHAR